MPFYVFYVHVIALFKSHLPTSLNGLEIFNLHNDEEMLL